MLKRVVEFPSEHGEGLVISMGQGSPLVVSPKIVVSNQNRFPSGKFLSVSIFKFVLECINFKSN